MSYLLTLTSDDMRPGDTTDDFTILFSPPVPIAGNWEIALESLSLWYSWYNISSDYGNQTFRYNNGTAWKDITITPGLYTIDNINTFVQAQMLANGDNGTGPGGNIFYITLTPDFNTFKLLITISNSYQVDLTVGNLYQLFGFDQIIVTTTQEGTNNVNITNGVNRILFHADCVVGSYKGPSASDVIYSFNADSAPSSLLQIKPNRPVYLPMNKSGYLFQVRLYVTDQLGRRVNLNGEELSTSMLLRRTRMR